MGRIGRFGSRTQDLRTTGAGLEENRAWCERASRSHVVIGVLGSHMVLPAGHAGGVVDLVPEDYLRNVLTDLLITSGDKRESLFLYRNLPLETSPTALASIVVSMLVNYSCAYMSLNGAFYAPLSESVCQRLAVDNRTRVESVEQTLSLRWRSLMGP